MKYNLKYYLSFHDSQTITIVFFKKYASYETKLKVPQTYKNIIIEVYNVRKTQL